MRHLLFVCLGIVLISGCASDDDRESPTAPPEAPAVPSGLHLADVGEDYVLLRWDESPIPAPGILVQGREAGAEDWNDLAERRPGSLTYEAAVAPESSHEYRIAAVREDVASAWTEPVAVTALPAGSWQVAGGIKTEADGDLSVYFEFGEANRFRSGGTLEIDGPVGWNGNQVLRLTGFEDMAIDLDNRGAQAGTYALSFVSEGGRSYAATVALDPGLSLSPPAVHEESGGELPGLLLVSWTAAGADRVRLCFGAAAAPSCGWTAASGDSVLNANDLPLPALLSLTAHRDAADADGDDAADRQLAKAVWSQLWN